MEREEVLTLLKKYNSGACSEAEKELVETWYLQYEQTETAELSQQEQEADLLRISATLPLYRPVQKVQIWPRIAAAAVILVLFSAGGYFLVHQSSRDLTTVSASAILPGSNKAILTLANGKRIVLNDAKQGQLASQGNSTVVKTGDGQLVYNKGENDGAGLMNTIATPRGGQYQITLPDGSKIWLNALSSLTFPTAFNSGERKVTLTGEAYFEVTKNKAMPFKVVSGNQTVKVLGTHFNINAYNDEPVISTTLLEGAVEVTTATHLNSRLKPGQQSINNRSDHSVKVQQADLAAATDWKNGRFKFSNENIKSIMRKLSRWYAIDVVYQGDMKNKEFVGVVSRYDRIEKVLDMLQSTNTIHFKIEGRRIIVKD